MFETQNKTENLLVHVAILCHSIIYGIPKLHMTKLAKSNIY